MINLSLEKNSLFDIDSIGKEWLASEIETITSEIKHLKPSEFLGKRYLTPSESQNSGFMSLEKTPYWIDILDCMDPFNPAREVSVKKGVKTSFNTTGIEGSLFYFAAFLKSFAGMFVTANKEMAQARCETNIIPMFQNSGFDIFQSLDADSPGKTGKTKNLYQWKGGGWMVPEGAKNADTMRLWSVMWMWLDELDTFLDNIDGDPVGLLKDRCAAFWNARKIMMGSTPRYKGASKIDIEFLRGDQCVYECKCLDCGFPMQLRWSHDDLNKPDVKRGMIWEYTTDDILDISSIRYECWNCGHGHLESDKEKFINKENAEWKATATPVEPGIRSFHVPGALSYYQPWSKGIGLWLEAYKPNGVVKNVGKLQVFYNNVLGESFELVGNKVPFQAVSGHRRHFYQNGEIPNSKIEQYCASHIMFVCMTVDVHDKSLVVGIWGFCIGSNPWLIDYKELEDKSEQGVLVIESPAWVETQRLIDEQKYIADDGKEYKIQITFIDSGDGDHESVVVDFCSLWEEGVYPIKGDSSSDKRIKNFKEMTTSAKTMGYLIAVDKFKDRMSPVLRRHWQPEFGDQPKYHFNASYQTTDKQIRELTKEYKKEHKKRTGEITTKWHRPRGSHNELWDLLIYAMAALEVLANQVCTRNLGLNDTDWPKFWQACEEDQLFYSLP